MMIFTSLFASLLLAVPSLAEFKITAPNGTSVVDYNTAFFITWENDNTNPVSFYLYSGYGAGLKQEFVIEANSNDKGRHRWVPFIEDSGQISSGCGYTISAYDGKTRAWSSYFTINKVKDGGLPLNSNCSSLATKEVFPDVSAVTTTAGEESPTGSSSSSNPSSTDDSSSGSSSGSSGSSGSSSGSSSSSKKSSKGISPAVLGGAIAGVAVVLLLLGGCCFFCLARKGFLQRKPAATQNIDSTYPAVGGSMAAAPQYQQNQQPQAFYPPPGSAHGMVDNKHAYAANTIPVSAPQHAHSPSPVYQLDGRNVPAESYHQLPGNEREK